MSKKQDKQALAAYQMASMLGSAGGMFGYHNPAQAQFANSMTDNAKGSIAAQTAYMQAKKQKEKESSGIGALAGTVIGAAVGGPAGAAIGGSIGGSAESAIGGNYGNAASTLAGGLAAAGAPTGTGGTLEPVVQADGGAAPGRLDSMPTALSAPPITAPVSGPIDSSKSALSAPPVVSPNMQARKEGLAKLDFKGADQVTQHGYMSVMLDAGQQPTREQWNAMSPADQKYWESRGVTPPQSAAAGLASVLGGFFGGTR